MKDLQGLACKNVHFWMKLLGWLNGGFKLVDAKDARLVQGLRG
jgi:hypothetical protein